MVRKKPFPQFIGSPPAGCFSYTSSLWNRGQFSTRSLGLWDCRQARGSAPAGFGSGRHRLVAAARRFTHGVQAFGVGHQRRSLAIAQGTAGGERQGDGRGGDVVRHLGDEHSVILAEGEVGIQHPAAELLDGSSYGVKAILRIGDQTRQGFGGVSYLMKKERHGWPPYGEKLAGDAVTMLLKTKGVKNFCER